MSFAVGAEVEFERYPSSWYRATVTAVRLLPSRASLTSRPGPAGAVILA